MKYDNIGSRLLTAACLVDNGRTVCDVGCDHGKLSLYLIKSGRAEKIIATDIHPLPLQKAITLFDENDVKDKVECLLTDGLQGIKNTDDISHIVIAGLGGETMANVIQKADFIKDNKTQLVLLPSQGAARIRRFLYMNGYEIIKEIAVSDKKKFYTAIHAIFTGKTTTPTLFDCYIGKSEHCTGSAAVGYFNMVLSQILKIKKGQMIQQGSCSFEICNAEKQILNLIASNRQN